MLEAEYRAEAGERGHVWDLKERESEAWATENETEQRCLARPCQVRWV